MSGGIGFDQHLAAYLAIRDALGLAAGARARLLRSFIDHTSGATPPGMPIRAATALAWACDHAPPGCGDAGKAHRLTVARGFLAYLAAVVPGTEVPAHGILASHRRRRPYIFSDAEIEMLGAAAAKAPPRGALRPVMLPALLGLLASTGLRIGEAVRLTTDDVRLDAEPTHLRVLQTKFHKSRLVPVHPTTAAALATYLHRRRQLGYHALSNAVFMAEHGGLRCCRDQLGGARALSGVAGSPLPDPGCYLAIQAERRSPPSHPQAEVQGNKLARLRRQPAPARKPDGLGRRGGSRGMDG